MNTTIFRSLFFVLITFFVGEQKHFSITMNIPKTVVLFVIKKTIISHFKNLHLLVWDAANCNRREGARLFEQRYSDCLQTHYLTFASSKKSSYSWRRSSSTPFRWKSIYNYTLYGILQVDATVQRALHEKLHPYHLQCIQDLNPKDYSNGLAFCQWFWITT